MNINAAVRRRTLGLSSRVDIDFVIDRLRLKEAIRLDPGQERPEGDLKTYGPMACTRLNSSIVAVANEDGYINLINSKKLKNMSHWLGHENAIFDIKASPDQRTLMTASGDATIKLWDAETKRETLTLSPHFSSIKSLSVYDRNTIASGSRDGSIKVHDLRQKEPTVIDIRDAHRNKTFSKVRKISTKTDPISCVTCVAFDPHFPRIYSTGANDATIKLWDLRRPPLANKPRRTLTGGILINQPTLEVHHPTKGMHCGYSHLLISSCKVYAACSDNKIYCYDNFGISEPVKFMGYSYDTYLRLAVLDDRFLISGAKNGGAIMWTLGNKCSSIYYPETTKYPIGQLKADNNENYDTNVIETDWDSLSVITFRDDRLVCKWSMQHVPSSDRKNLAGISDLTSNDNDVTIQMSDIIDMNVLRPNHRVSNSQTSYS